MKTEVVVISIGAALLVALATCDLQRRHDTASQLAFQGKMCGVGIAVHRYKEHYGHYPPQQYRDPKSGFHHSWRVLVLEFIDHVMFSKYDFGKDWNDPHNLELLRGENYFGYEPKSSYTNIVVIHGKRTIFSSDAQPLRVNERLSATVLMLAQVGNSNVVWLDPSDLDIDLLSNENLNPIIGLMFLDVTYRKIQRPVSATVIRSLAEPVGDLSFDLDSICR